MSYAAQTRQALEQFKAQNPNWAIDGDLYSQWAHLQRQYEIALHGYALF